MKKILVSSIVVATLIAVSLPAFAWQATWFEGFERYTSGTLGARTDPTMYGAVPTYLPAVIVNPNPGQGAPAPRTGFKAMRQQTGTTSPLAVKKTYVSNDVRGSGPTTGNVPYWSYGSGWARAYMWDPGDTRTTLSTIGADARFGVRGSVGDSTIGHAATTAITDSRSVSYWVAQWSYSVGILDGVTTPAGGAGFTFTVGAAAPRVYNAWSYVLTKWGFTYTGWNRTTNKPTGGSGWIQWFVNSSTVPALRVDITSATGRWANMYDVAGTVFGSIYGNLQPGTVDDVDLRGNLADPMNPEPGGMLVLGAGLLGLAGFIRRRR
jgi:hypothetical protein